MVSKSDLDLSGLEDVIRRAFPDMPKSEAANLISIGTIGEYPADVVLCKEGEIESIFYIILSGEVQVRKNINDIENRILKPLGPGDFFGEYALIHNAPRTATVVSMSSISVLEIHKADFVELLNRSTSVSKAMVREVSRRLRENDQMAIEDLRIKASELANAYQRLAELDIARREFLTTIAHELRTPLTAAGGFLTAIQMGILKDEALNAAIDTIARNIQRIITLTNDILFLQEVDLILQEAKPIDVGELVGAAVDRQRNRLKGSKLEIKLEVAPNLPEINGDRESLERAFIAILENAIKFSPHGDKVNVRVFRDGAFVNIEVEDYGVGIPKKALPHIFDRFYHTDELDGNLFEGVGLGLSIAQQVVEQHNGKITVESTLGVGSKFVFHLGI